MRNLIKSSGEVANGRDLPTTCNLIQVHDFIEIKVHLIRGPSPEIKALYLEGYSIRDLAAQFNLSTGNIREQLLKQRVTLRPAKAVKNLDSKRRTFKSSAPPVFGFYFLEGQLQKHPKEYPIVQIIERQTAQGYTPTEIAASLNKKKLKTRMGRAWTQAHVFNVIKRIKQRQQNEKRRKK